MEGYALEEWAARTFSRAELGDPRRTTRLVELSVAIAGAPSASLPRALGGVRSAMDGCYDLLRSEHFDYDALVDALCEETIHRMMSCEETTEFLLVGDTTVVNFEYPSAFALCGPTSAKRSSRGVLVHTVTAVNASNGAVLGIVAMRIWKRKREEHGKKKSRKSRRYEEKESFKWQACCEDMLMRLGEELMSRCRVVFDRESDIPELLTWLDDKGLSFTLRSSYNRKLTHSEKLLRDHLKAEPVIATYEVGIAQRGGRPARTAVVDARVSRVTLTAPYRKKEHTQPKNVELTAVMLSEASPPEGSKGLCWVLFSDTPIEEHNVFDVVNQLRQGYAHRWICEEYHRCWKSVLRAERSRLRTFTGLCKLLVIRAGIAVKLVEVQKRRGDEQSSCLELLSPLEWKLLWAAVEHSTPPHTPPSAAWAYRAIARLGGWADTQRTGRAGPKALEEGIRELQTLMLGARLSAQISASPPSDE